MRRMKEHCKYYQKPIYILWVSPEYSKYTALRIEDRQKEQWIAAFPLWQYIENDRFIIPKEYSKVIITVRKDYEILLE